MAKTLKPKCIDILYQLKERAIRQIDQALRLLIEQGETHNFNCFEKGMYNCLDKGERKDFDGCVSCHCNVFRFNEHGELVYYNTQFGWEPICCHDNATDLAKAADTLLEKATAKPESEDDIIPLF